MNATFIKSANFVNQYHKDKRSQACFVGRSNVGKSSLINALSNNSKLAKTSSKPGHTRLVNFFDFKSFVLVDLPGYGFAKTNKAEQDLINNLIVEYLNYGHNLNLVVQLINIDVITDEDKKMCSFLKKQNVKHLIVLTKADRVNKSHFDNNKKKIVKYLNHNEEDILAVSVKNKTNIDKLLSIIKAMASRED